MAKSASEDSSQQTPVMKQFYGLKAEAGEALLFFRMGDFYELFAEDAVIAAPILGITLTSRDKKSANPIAMAGVPFHSATQYIQKLLKAGKKVAVAEQQVPEGMTASQLKGIVERKIVRIFSPAVQFEMGDDPSPKYLAGVTSLPNKKYAWVLLDPPTGEVRISEHLELEDLIASGPFPLIHHFLHTGAQVPPLVLSSLGKTLIEEIPHNWVADRAVNEFLQKQYGRLTLHPFLETAPIAKTLALLIQYVLKTQGLERLSHLHDPKSLTESTRLVVGPQTHQHLDSDDLFTLINQTRTSMGSRFLRQDLNAPFKAVAEINVRQAAVKELAENSLASSQIHESLRSVYDLDRILGRISTRLAHPRDTYALGLSLQSAFQFVEKLSEFKTPVLKRITEEFKKAKTTLGDVSDRIVRTQKAEAPVHVRDGGIFEFGTDSHLDRLIQLTTQGEKYIIDLEQAERKATGIQSLKIKYNRVFGYFIEISSANLKNAPEHYQRKQTMVGGERFFTEELKKFEEEVLSAAQKQKALEAELFDDLLETLIKLSEPLKDLSQSIAELDALISLSTLAQKSSWNFPNIDESFEFHLEHSRHPLVDDALHGDFVPNSVSLLPETARTLIITGPNMGGKSTLMRQMAQIILLGQMGAPVPAQGARWGVFESLFTRIGAHDAIAKGQSTFMVEMSELAHILRHANERSFIVLDEIGRGTSTYDGMSVASASLSHLHQTAKARMVFATHYHELTALESELPGLMNAHMRVLDEKGKLTFLYELAPGKTSKSFGIQVAELAGLPTPVIRHAWEILDSLETKHEKALEQKSDDPDQLSLFSVATAHSSKKPTEPGLTLDATTLEIQSALRQEIESLDVNAMRPLDALNTLAELQERYKTPAQ